MKRKRVTIMQNRRKNNKVEWLTKLDVMTRSLHIFIYLKSI